MATKTSKKQKMEPDLTAEEIEELTFEEQCFSDSSLISDYLDLINMQRSEASEHLGISYQYLSQVFAAQKTLHVRTRKLILALSELHFIKTGFLNNAKAIDMIKKHF